MPLIIPSNSISAVGGYEIDNSLRFNDGSSDYLNITQSAGNRQIFTYSLWVKRSTLGNRQRLIRDYNSSTAIFQIYFESSNDTLFVLDYTDTNPNPIQIRTNQVFRDPSAWYHIVVSIDTTQATSSNRVKIYVNGSQVTSFAEENYPSQNFNSSGNQSGNTLYIGSTGSGDYYDGYMSEVVLIDGQQLDPTSFGEFDEDSGIWKPIDVSGLTFGTNGFYLPFENSAALGQDDSGNGNNFTVNNLTSIDQTTDTPTNNFATLNPLSSTASTLSEGNLKFVYASGTYSNGKGTLAVSQGKWYVEAKATTIAGTNYPGWGIADVGIDWSSNPDNGAYIGQQSNQAYGFFPQLGVYLNSSNILSITDVISSGDIIGLALDLDSVQNTLKIYQNGSLLGTANINPPNNAYIFGASINTSASSAVTEFNFGNPPYTISSGNSDGNGYGLFEYQPPSGYLALCTKNLATDG